MFDLFDRIASRATGALAGWRDGQPVPHADVLARIRAWAALGARTPARQVALFHDDTLEFGAALIGAWLSGKTVWLAADTLPANCAALSANVEAFWGQFPLALDASQPAPHEFWHGPIAAPAPDFPALVVYTSGSTGAPTPIPKSLSQLTSEVAALEQAFGHQLTDAAVLATVSHHHIYGLLFRVLWPLASGRPVEAARHEFPETLAPALAARPCLLLASPAHLKRLPAHLDWQGAGQQLRAVFSSGGMLAADASTHAATLLGTSPIEVYGSSESGGVAWRQRVNGESWRALPGVSWRQSEDGTLDVDSPFAGGTAWLRLADRIEPCGDGQFVLLGRADRIVKIEEKRVSLDALEAHLLATGLLAEARVVHLVDGAREQLAVFGIPTDAGRVLLTQGRAHLTASLRSALAALVEAVALPRRWRYLDQWPVNAQGKTPQSLLMALLDGKQDGQLQGRPRLPQMVIVAQTPGRAELTLTVPPDLLYFDGHFHVAPVLPGVVQVDWAIHYAREVLGLHGTFGGINALKFQQMIRPGHPVRLELAYDQAKGSLNFRYFSDAGAHASGRILLELDSTC